SSAITNQKPKVLVSENNFEVINTGLFNATVLKLLINSDIVQFEYPYFFFLMMFLKLIGKKYVYDAHDVEFFLSKNMQKITALGKQKKSPFAFLNKFLQQTPMVVLLIEGISVKFSSTVFACSKTDAAEILRIYRVPQRRVVVIPNCGRASLYQRVKV